MKQGMSMTEIAAKLGLTVEVARGLIAVVFGARRDVLSPADVKVLREAHARIVELHGEAPAPQPTIEPKWNDRGQAMMDFTRPSRGAPWLRAVAPVELRRDADELFARALELDESDVDRAFELYSEALAANPHHADAHVNMGRLLHQRGALKEAEAHYVAALVSRATDATATFNLAVVLEDLGRLDDAMTRYREAIELDPHCVDAYFNLSRLYEKKGEKLAAIRHLKDYRRLVNTP